MNEKRRMTMKPMNAATKRRIKTEKTMYNTIKMMILQMEFNVKTELNVMK